MCDIPLSQISILKDFVLFIVTRDFQQDFKTQELPLARIKKIMKMDEEVKVNSLAINPRSHRVLRVIYANSSVVSNISKGRA